MCLAVPGKVVAISGEDAGGVGSVGTVDFQGSRMEVSLAFTPEAREGDWVLVHAGFALQVLDEQAARETWQYLAEADLAEMPGPVTGEEEVKRQGDGGTQG
ncbi:MAG TPA: HypC/HybG/HupF family hydrogenase formation chaperone [Phycisphaerae bacterium]|jgi:hydrogenase expression/formation protein HypC|nr:HypC/HybG/HupF family hydrogenase formation chaperone [Phycisphaerae bacterium]HOB74586.1 HypC/HybG/HupF family hydrogenase formation chaperone [Phycisphaerae bacterium]HOJ53541.1 HypC/HybG/HupF family hydrogenase formation chaperone [Phycisphaerae bacterium]HOL25302.1 HypC/HybG/HupF family hydrogenase formation chaperone [Phycisphaerae bacterium]HPP20483.1 HypC/HybG/HupF family hydrogenase formation chaperone [Phycisphaerae bacterium]